MLSFAFVPIMLEFGSFIATFCGTKEQEWRWVLLLAKGQIIPEQVNHSFFSFKYKRFN